MYYHFQQFSLDAVNRWVRKIAQVKLTDLVHSTLWDRLTLRSVYPLINMIPLSSQAGDPENRQE